MSSACKYRDISTCSLAWYFTAGSYSYFPICQILWIHQIYTILHLPPFECIQFWDAPEYALCLSIQFIVWNWQKFPDDWWHINYHGNCIIPPTFKRTTTGSFWPFLASRHRTTNGLYYILRPGTSTPSIVWRFTTIPHWTSLWYHVTQTMFSCDVD